MLVIHDAFGFSDDVRRIARRFAENGYAALAPALYDGAGAPVLCVVRTIRDLQARTGSAFDRIEAARTHAAALSAIDGDRLGITGFCLGGGFAIFGDSFDPSDPENQAALDACSAETGFARIGGGNG